MADYSAILKPGDVLLFDGSSFFDHAIKIKTWSDVCHSETYIGGMKTAASRNGQGVQTYDFDPSGLKHILRPNVVFDFIDGLKWHNSVIGQKYDWKGLLVFTLAVKHGTKDKMWCSEHTHRFCKKSKYYPLGTHLDSDKTAPDDFEKSPSFTWLYENRPEDLHL